MADKSSHWGKPALFFIAAGGLFALWILLPVKEMLQSVLQRLESFGVIGLAVLAVVYVFACVLLVPGSILTLGAGFLASAIWVKNPILAILMGTVTVSAGSIIGASSAFLLGRTLAREWISEKVNKNQKFRDIDKAIGESGFKMVFLVRLSPIFPFNLLNYALGLTKVSFRSYFFASWIGMLPGTIMYVYLGSVAQNMTALAAGRTETSLAQKLLLWMGLLATIIVVVLITKIAARVLKQSIPEEQINGE